MKQKEIWLANLNPSKGSEQQETRPIVIVSGNSMNDNLNIGIVCPLTTVVKKYAGCLMLKADILNGLKENSEVITFQIRTISKERLITKLGEITIAQMALIKTGLQEILTY